MSKVKISPFRVTAQTARSDYGITRSPVRCFSGDRQLQLTETEPIIAKEFNPDDDPLRIELKISIRDVVSLYHPFPTAVASEGSVLGVALFWESRESGRRGIGTHHLFSQHDNVSDVLLSLDFKIGELRQELIFTPKLFLHSVESIQPSYCSIQGAVLGSLDEKQIVVIDGNGSRYPIYEAAEGLEAPLWRLIMDWNDPLEDHFSNHFKIILNNDHSDYPMVKRIEDPLPGQDIVPVALKEILTSTLFGMMMKLRDNVEDWNSIIEGRSAPRSVGHLAWIYINHMNWNLVSPAELLQDIRKTVQAY